MLARPESLFDSAGQRRVHRGLSAGELQTYGDFVVCPFTKPHAGWMQFVCIDRAARLVVEQWHEKSRTFEYVTGPQDTILKSDLKPFP
jgi:hypothetical protein